MPLIDLNRVLMGKYGLIHKISYSQRVDLNECMKWHKMVHVVILNPPSNGEAIYEKKKVVLLIYNSDIETHKIPCFVWKEKKI